MQTKLTIEDIKSKITNTTYFKEDTLTICGLTLQNGYKVTGESACIDISNYNEKLQKETQIMGIHLGNQEVLFNNIQDNSSSFQSLAWILALCTNINYCHVNRCNYH